VVKQKTHNQEVYDETPNRTVHLDQNHEKKRGNKKFQLVIEACQQTWTKSNAKKLNKNGSTVLDQKQKFTNIHKKIVPPSQRQKKKKQIK
jgi:hypothetical protein